MNQDLSINYEALREKLLVIEEDIAEIESILGEATKANKSLDERAWKSTEKQKMDANYIPYIEKVSVNAPNVLRNHVKFLRKTLNIYEEVEKEISQNIETELTDLS